MDWFQEAAMIKPEYVQWLANRVVEQHLENERCAQCPKDGDKFGCILFSWALNNRKVRK